MPAARPGLVAVARVVALASVAAPARAQDVTITQEQSAAPGQALLPFGTFFSPVVGKLNGVGSYGLTIYPDRPVEGQSADLGMVQNDLFLLFPVSQSPRHEWSLFTRVREQEFDTEAILPDTHDRFPSELWDVRLGSTYRYQFENTWIGGANVTVGSPSDKPFHSIHEVDASVTGFLRIPQGEKNAWLLSLNYSNNREFLNGVPIPGVAYWWQPIDQLRIIAGFPFASIDARPTKDLSLHLTYAAIHTIRSRVNYRLLDWLAVHAGFDWINQRYLRADRPANDDRFFYYEKSATGGVRFNVARRVSIDVIGGYAFDRFYFEGENYDDHRRNRIDVAATPIASIRLGARF